MNKNEPHPTAEAAPGEHRSALNARARSGTVWIVAAFGFGQAFRVVTNIVLASILFEAAFALMALVTAVLMGLAMFSDVGLQQNVVQNPRGDDPAFLDTAWTMQVIRGAALTVLAALCAWPMAVFYGANDPTALELRWLIPIVALTALIDGLRSPRVLSALRHLQVAKLTRIELGVTIVNSLVIIALAWYTRSVYALAVAAVLSSTLHTVLTYRLLPGPRARFIIEPQALRSILSFGKWIFLSSLLYFLAIQIDRLVFSANYPLAEVGVYSIAASLALMVPTVVGKLQISVVFPWYARMLDDGMSLPDAFMKAQGPVLAMSTYLVVLLIVGAGSFFSLAYDDRYAQGAVFLPVLALGIWFSNLGGVYASAYLVKGLSKWVAMVNGVKVLAFLLMFALLSRTENSIVMGALAVLASELITVGVSRYLAWQLGLKRLRGELVMLAMLLSCSAFCLALLHYVEPLANLHPALQLLLLGVVVTAWFTPSFLTVFRPIVLRYLAAKKP